MPDHPTREEMNARLEAAEARTETRFAQLMTMLEQRFAASDAKMDARFGAIDVQLARLETRIDNVERNTSGLRATIIGTGIAVLALAIGAMAYGQAWFSTGLSNRDYIRAIAVEMQQAQQQATPQTPAATK